MLVSSFRRISVSTQHFYFNTFRYRCTSSSNAFRFQHNSMQNRYS
jgi:hypothetical protein